MTNPILTIAICTYNRSDYLSDTLKDLSVQTANNKHFEILVVNNNSTDATSNICQEFQHQNSELPFRFVTEKKQGLSFARNRAITESFANFILYIDDDVYIPHDFIQTALQEIDQHPELRCAGGRIFVTFDDFEPNWIPKELMPMFGLHNLGGKTKKYPVSNFPRGGNMIIHKSVFKKTGRFDTSLGRTGTKLLGSEEKAFFERARKYGFHPVYIGSLEHYHRIGKNRLQQDYLEQQSKGIGISERLRCDSSQLKKSIKLISECSKLGLSLILAIGYLLTGKMKAARFLIQFRLWVLQGFVST